MHKELLRHFLHLSQVDESLLLHLRSLTFLFSCVMQAALLALKTGGNPPEQEGVNVEVEEPENCGNGCTHESEARQSSTNFKSVKVEPVAPEDDYPSKCIIPCTARLISSFDRTTVMLIKRSCQGWCNLQNGAD